MLFTKLESNEIVEDVKINTTSAYGVVDTLYHTIQERKNEDTTKSYTSKLLNGNQNSMLKKIVEEARGVLFAIKDNNTDEAIYEAADTLLTTF